MEKISGDPNWFRNWGFCHFLKVVSYFPDIAQDCSLGECLTSSRAETFKKKCVIEIGAEMMSSNVYLNLLVYG